MMKERIEYQEVMTCTHDYVERCHDTFVTKYEPHQELKCNENFRKVCNIIYEDSASNDIVEECRTQLVKTDPCEEGPEECHTVDDIICDTKIRAHEVIDDIVNCETVYEQQCHNVTQGKDDSKDESVESNYELLPESFLEYSMPWSHLFLEGFVHSLHSSKKAIF